MRSMKDIYTAILASLASGEKSRSQIAKELGLPPPKVAGALVEMVAGGQVGVSGKVRVGGKDVSVYTATSQQSVKRETPPSPLSPLTDGAVAKLLNSNLYQIWGGYALLDTPHSKGLAVRRYT
jgi:hypothetical protein